VQRLGLRLVRTVRGEKAYDLLVQSEVGLLDHRDGRVTGTRGDFVADIAAGMYAYSGILTALVARGTTGHGTAIDVSLFDALGEWMGYAAYFAAYSGRRLPAAVLIMRRSRHGPVRAGDGGQVYLGIQNARMVAVLRRRPRAPRPRARFALQHQPAAGSSSHALHDVIESAFAALTTAE
jgi:crotonobetainyl-CoA:carnitine CoA-transferase CaiB-like acyl-CoA transferase